MTTKSKRRSYRGSEITVSFDARRCIHAARCVHGLPGVFDPQRRPWIEPDGAAAERVAEVVRACPTGALQYEPAGGVEAERPAERNTVTVRPNGSLHLRGDLAFVSPEGVETRETRAALCRCGASSNKPYCDNTHEGAGFTDPGVVTNAKLAPVKEAESGSLKIACVANGPVLVEGPMELRDGSGETVAAGGKAALCRCGASANRPFCDGSHVAIGFETEE